jgi:Zn-dependent protease with chaperone function
MSGTANYSTAAPNRPAPSDRSDFFDEQKRRRRAARFLSGICLLIASGIGIVLSSVVTPLLLLTGGGLLHLLARLGVFPEALRSTAHGLGAWAAAHGAHFEALVDSLDHVNGVRDLGVTIAPLLRLAPVAVPALIAACLVWIVLRQIGLRGAGGDLITRLHARTPDPHDQEERQLANIVAEMAIAAGLPAPALLLIDSPEINAAAAGGTRGQASVLVTRGLLDRLDRDETSGVVAHLVASIGAGDIRLTHGILAVFQTFGFFVTFLDLPFRWSAWRALGGLVLVAAGLRRSTEMVAQTLESVERSMDAEAMPDVEKVWSVIPWRRVRLLLLAPLLPLILISLILRLVLFLWTALFLGPPLALIWRNRRYAADAMAVQLTRSPDGLARALSRIGGAGIPDGGEGREYCFVHGPPSRKKGGFTDRRTITLSLHPSLGRRLQRLHALGATAGGGERVRVVRFDMIARYPGRALLVALLLALLLPLGVTLVLAVGYLTAIAMTLGLAAGLAISAGLLG